MHQHRLLQQSLMSFLLISLSLGLVNAGELVLKFNQPNDDGDLTDDGVMCPDQNSKCPRTATCCQMSSGQWGCCPFLQGSCCSDKMHCCPQGFSCNTEKGNCMKIANNDTIPWATKETAPSISSPSIELASSEEKAPDGCLLCQNRRNYCGQYASCCRTYSGYYTCCNYPNNVCCADGIHCCRRCTICDQLRLQCTAGAISEEWKALTESIPTDAGGYEEIDSPAEENFLASLMNDTVEEETDLDSTYERCSPRKICVNGNHCCLSPRGKWRCCASRQTRDLDSAYERCSRRKICVNGNYCCLSPRGKWRCCASRQTRNV